MQEKRDIKKIVCGIIYIFIVILISKYLDSACKGTRITIIPKVSDNIRRLRISQVSKYYEVELETSDTPQESKELYVEKVYKKLLEEPKKADSSSLYNTNKLNSITKINASQIKIPNIGDLFATISIPSCQIYTRVVFGLTQSLVDSYDIAMQDAISSVYVNPMLPGFGRPILMGGHNYKSLGRLKNIKLGSIITISTNYGNFYYTVTEAKKAKLNVHGTTLLDIDNQKNLITYYGGEQLQIYTCDSDNPSDGTRFFVRAIRTGGTEVIF
mgnify:FL=1